MRPLRCVRRRLRPLHRLLFALAVSLAASGCDAGYREASCQTCDGRTFSSSDCARFAEAAGCSSSMVATPGAGCSGRCVFMDCTGVPICATLAPRDAGATGDDAP